MVVRRMYAAQQLARQQGIVGRALSEGRVQLVRDTASDPDFSASVDRQTGFRTRSILCAPLIVKGELLGALEAINKRQTRPELDAAGGLFADADREDDVETASYGEAEAKEEDPAA